MAGQLHRGGRAQPNLPSRLASAAAALRGPRGLAPPGAGRHQGGCLVDLVRQGSAVVMVGSPGVHPMSSPTRNHHVTGGNKPSETIRNHALPVVNHDVWWQFTTVYGGMSLVAPSSWGVHMGMFVGIGVVTTHQLSTKH